MASFLEKLAARVLVADGAMGTMLQGAGLPSGHCGELWNVEEPARIRGIHEAYLNAGSDIILTNTFGGSRLRLAESGNGERTAEINRAAARVAREAAAPFGGIVFGDIGPSGQLMEPFGDVSEEDMFASFLVQAEALVAGDVDAIIVETMMALNEMVSALKAVRAASADIPLVASFSFKKSGNEFRTLMGETITQCVEEASDAGADVIGTNCGLGIDEMIEVVRAIRSCTDKPIIAQPNAGLPEVVAGKVIYRQTPAMMVEKVPALVAAGAGIVGGCCGTNPEYIALLKQKLSAK
jgi:5-methyltetrahydrofolate--homocysteine methyltransferase